MRRKRARPPAARAAIRRGARFRHPHGRERGTGAGAGSRRPQEQGWRGRACLSRDDRAQAAIRAAPLVSNSAQATGTRGGAGRRRSVARLLAVQALYQIELSKIEAGGGAGADAVIAEFVKHRLGQEIEGENYGEADRALFVDIVRGASARRGELDGMISSALSEEWPLHRLGTIPRALLPARALRLPGPTHVSPPRRH